MKMLDRFYQKNLRPFLAFLRKIVDKVLWIFKKIFLNKYVGNFAIILQTVWPILLVLIINYQFFNLMEQSQDLLDALMQNFIYSFSAFTCLFFYCLAVWYTIRIIFILKDQKELIPRLQKNDFEDVIINKRKEDNIDKKNKDAIQKEKEDAIQKEKEDILKGFTKWTPI